MDQAARERRDLWLVAAVAGVLSAAAFLYYYSQDAILLYGDAVARINIARAIFDSRTPGPFQFGTVWLPLHFLLMMPFLLLDSLWTSGVGGSIVSMLAYVWGCIGVFRLVRMYAARSAAWIAAAIYAANPNLLYMQSTAMTEALFLGVSVWAVYYFARFHRALDEDAVLAGRAIVRCSYVLAAGMLVRYDGWFLAFVLGIATLFILARRRRALADAALKRSLRNAVLFAAAVPILWLAYNFGTFGDPLEFLRGPYSAKAIAQRTTPPGAPGHPGQDSPYVAAIHYLKSARLNVAEGSWEFALWLFAIAGSALVLWRDRRRWPLLLFWTPAIFYMLSVAYGSLPIFMPQWWPFSYYNVRYGLQMLPVFAILPAMAYDLRARNTRWWMDEVWMGVLLAVAVASYASVWGMKPITLREAEVNSRERMGFEKLLAERLRQLPPDATMLIFSGSYSGALQRAGIHFERTLNEKNYPFWQDAVKAPSRYTDYVIAISGDPIAEAVAQHPDGLREIDRVQYSPTRSAVIYATTRTP